MGNILISVELRSISLGMITGTEEIAEVQSTKYVPWFKRLDSVEVGAGVVHCAGRSAPAATGDSRADIELCRDPTSIGFDFRVSFALFMQTGGISKSSTHNLYVFFASPPFDAQFVSIILF